MTTEVFSITADRPEQETLPLMAVARESDVKNVGMLERNLLSLSYGKIVRKDINSADGLLPASFETYQIVEPGMTILRFTDLQNDQRSLRSGLVTERGIITSAYVAVDPFAMDPQFFAYMMRAYDTNKVFYGMGGGVRQGLNFDSIRRLPVPNLPFDEQRAIVYYLDQETAQIDALVAKQEEFIGLLRERRASLVSNEMLQSLGTPTPLRRVVDVIDCAHVTAEFVKGDERFPVASIRECQGELVDLANCKYTTAEFYRHLRASGRAPRVGDLLFIRNVSVGLVAAVAPGTREFAVGQETVLLRRKATVDSKYLRHALTSAQVAHEIEGAMIGSTFRRINVAAIRSLTIPLPRLEEQVAITRRIDEATVKIDSLISKAQEHIALAKERRSALITAAITGQFDVRTVKKEARV